MQRDEAEGSSGREARGGNRGRYLPWLRLDERRQGEHRRADEASQDGDNEEKAEQGGQREPLTLKI